MCVSVFLCVRADLLPHLPNATDFQLNLAHPKFQVPSINITGGGGWGAGNASDILVPLVPILGLKAATKALPLLPLLALLNSTHSGDFNLTIPSLPSLNISHSLPSLNISHGFPSLNISHGLPSLNISGMAVPLGALLALPKAHKALPLLPLLSLFNVTSGLGFGGASALNLTIPHPHLPSLNISGLGLGHSLNISHSLPSLNISDVGVPLAALLAPKFHGLPLLALLGNVSANLPVFASNVSVPLPLLGAVPFKALLGLKALPFLAPKLPLLPLLGLGNVTDLAFSALAGLGHNASITGVPLGGLASLQKSVNISDLPLAALLSLGSKGLLSGVAGAVGNLTGPSVDVSVRKGSIGTKNLAFNVTHPTLGLKPLALALNITHPELALKLAALNLSLPVPDLRLGSTNINVSVPTLDINPQFDNVNINVPVAGLTLPTIGLNGSDGNSTG